jgi:hypothetical protein
MLTLRKCQQKSKVKSFEFFDEFSKIGTFFALIFPKIDNAEKISG